jgi:hypothetical protein
MAAPRIGAIGGGLFSIVLNLASGKPCDKECLGVVNSTLLADSEYLGVCNVSHPSVIQESLSPSSSGTRCLENLRECGKRPKTRNDNNPSSFAASVCIANSLPSQTTLRASDSSRQALLHIPSNDAGRSMGRPLQAAVALDALLTGEADRGSG